MTSVRIDEITPAWIAEHLPAVGEAIGSAAAALERAAGARTLEASLDAARAAGAAAERERIFSIEALASTDRKLLDRLKRDPAVSPTQAALEILRADRVSRGTRLQALVDDERDLVAPAPTGAGEGNHQLTAKAAVAMAVKMGVIR